MGLIGILSTLIGIPSWKDSQGLPCSRHIAFWAYRQLVPGPGHPLLGPREWKQRERGVHVLSL